MGCRRVAPQEQLVRVVVDAEGELQVGRHLAGRGAWLCRDSPECLRRAKARRAFARALRRPLAAGAEDRLAERLAMAPGGPDGRESVGG